MAGGAAKAGATLNGLQSLVQKSLVMVECAPEGLRYRLLDSVRLFACARLSAMGQEDRVRQLHAVYFSYLAARAANNFLGEKQVAWMDHIDLEWSNVRAAWEWLLPRTNYQALAIDLLTGLHWHFWIRGKYSEALQWYCEAQDILQGCAAADQARLFNGYATTLLHAAQINKGIDCVRRATVGAQEAGLQWELAFALSLSAWLAVIAGRSAEGRRFTAEAMTVCAPLNQPVIRRPCTNRLIAYWA